MGKALNILSPGDALCKPVVSFMMTYNLFRVLGVFAGEHWRVAS